MYIRLHWVYKFNFSADINECIVDKPCHERANCNNTVGAYFCTCLPGWIGNGVNCDGEYNQCFCTTLQHGSGSIAQRSD